MRTSRRIVTCVPVLLLLAADPGHAFSIQIAGSLTHEHEVAVGKAYEGSIVVQNPTDSAREVKVTLSDYLFFADGTTYYGDPGSMPRSISRWVTFAPKQLVIPAGEEATVRYAIQVPDDARLRGTYWGVFLIEPVDPASPESSLPGAKDRVTVGVRQVFRFAVQIVAHVGQTGTRQLKFVNVRLASPEGKRQLLVDVENTGERWLRGTLMVEIYGKDGALIGRFESGRLRMYPGTSVRYGVELPGVLPGTYKALIVIDCGGDDVFGANVNLVLAP